MITLQNEFLGVVIDPERGMTIESLLYQGKEYLVWEKEKKESRRTYGIPFLFPTPSNVADNVYQFQGRQLPAVMHGFLRNETFWVVEQSLSQMTGLCSFDGSNPLFPYRAMFSVSIVLEERNLSWNIAITNLGEEAFGYGLGLHPYFRKAPGMLISTSFADYLPCDPQLLPSGEIKSVQGTILDFRELKAIDDLVIDMVFLSEGPFHSTLRYQDSEFELSASEDFTHGVLYTDTQKDYICIEPMTCSTDAHNLAASGYQRASGLIVLEAGEQRESWVRLSARDIQESESLETSLLL